MTRCVLITLLMVSTVGCADEPIVQSVATNLTTADDPQLPSFMTGTWSCTSSYNPVDVWHASSGPSTYTAVKLPNGHVRGTYHEERAAGRDDFSDEWVITPNNAGGFTLDYSMSAEDGTIASATGTIALGGGVVGFVGPMSGTIHLPDGTILGWQPTGFAFQGPRFGSPPGLNLAWGFLVQISATGFEEYFAMNCTQKIGATGASARTVNADGPTSVGSDDEIAVTEAQVCSDKRFDPIHCNIFLCATEAECGITPGLGQVVGGEDGSGVVVLSCSWDHNADERTCEQCGGTAPNYTAAWVQAIMEAAWDNCDDGTQTALSDAQCARSVVINTALHCLGGGNAAAPAPVVKP